MNTMQHLKGKRLLALDIGKNRIGIAVSDILHITTTPLTVIQHDALVISKLMSIIEKEKPSCIVVGMPKESKGQNNNIIPIINSIVESLQQNTDIEILFQDESFSSKNAVNLLVEAGTSKKKRKDKGTIDKTAAAVILRSFLDDHGL